MAADESPRRSRWGEAVGDGALAVAQALSAGGLWVGGGAALATGKFMLGGVLAVLGIGVFLRIKRLRKKARR